MSDSSAPETATRPARGLFAGLTRNVLVLGLVSLFTDISSEMIIPVRILFFVNILKVPLPLAGLIEGIAESTASLLKIVSGRIADRMPQRKPLILGGYAVSNLTKPLLSIVQTWPAALGLVFVDRVGKGIRGAPRDAVIADSTPKEFRGKAFGFHRMMDTLGAAIGPLLTALILALNGHYLRDVFGWTLVPGVISILILVLFLRERPRAAGQIQQTEAPPAKHESILEQIRSLGAPFWIFTGIATLFALGNSSDAFIFLRAAGLESTLEAVPLVYFGYNLIYALASAPLGVLSDRWGRRPVLIGGYLVFALVYGGWAVATEQWHVIGLFLVYGLYAAATDGVSKALVTDLIPKGKRGTAMGWFNGLVGFAALPANLLSGWLWASFGPQVTFMVGAVLGITTAVLMVVWTVHRNRSERAA